MKNVTVQYGSVQYVTDTVWYGTVRYGDSTVNTVWSSSTSVARQRTRLNPFDHLVADNKVVKVSNLDPNLVISEWKVANERIDQMKIRKVCSRLYSSSLSGWT